MDGSSDKRRKRYVDWLKSEPKTCMIHGVGNSSNKYKVLGEFGTKYASSHITKDRVSNPAPKKIFH